MLGRNLDEMWRLVPIKLKGVHVETFDHNVRRLKDCFQQNEIPDDLPKEESYILFKRELNFVGFELEINEATKHLLDLCDGSRSVEAIYKEIAPNPDGFPELVRKLVELDSTDFAWDEDVAKIAAPTLIVTGDSDASTMEHMVAMYRLLGGGAMGDMAGISKARLAVLPATTHFIPPGLGVLDRHEWLLALIPAFLDAPDPIPAPAF